MSTAGKVIISVVAIGTVGVIAWLILKSANPASGRPPATAALSGAGAGAAPLVPRTNNPVTNTVNDLLSFAKQGVDIYSSWNKSKSMAS